MIQLRQTHSDVYYSNAENFAITREEIDFLKQRAGTNPRKRARICSHQRIDDPLHEMLIVLAKDSYVRPHKHLGKPESMYVLEGRVDFLLFDEAGRLETRIPMGGYDSGKSFYHYMHQTHYHSLLVRSEYLVYHEVTQGPFDPELTLTAPWAPDESRPETGLDFLEAALLRLSPALET